MQIIFETLVWAITAFLVVAALLPLVPLPVGLIRMFDFSRPGAFWLGIGTLAVLALVLRGDALDRATLLIGLATLMQAFVLWRYTRLGPKQIRRPRGDEEAPPARHVRLLLANVKMSNRDYARLIAHVKSADPDIFVAVETDDDWAEALRDLEPLFAEVHEWPRDTGYGAVLYSKLPLGEIEELEAVTSGAPAWTTPVTLPDGARFQLRLSHPEPVVVHRDTEARDAELMGAAQEARVQDLPLAVVGDMNDVPWSPSVRRMLRLSSLCDPRLGRGIYPTFDARNPLLRWPVDHLFLDPEFRLIRMERGPDVGSDHFPMLWHMVLADEKRQGPGHGVADKIDRAVMHGILWRERRRRRRPAGENWEKDAEARQADRKGR